MDLTGSLSLMALSAGLDQPQGPIRDLSSWAPDFRHEYLRKFGWSIIVSYSASASEMAKAAISPNRKVLSADTIMIDRIQFTDADKDENLEDRKLEGKLCWMYLVLRHQRDTQTSTMKCLFSRERLPMELFDAISWPDHCLPQDYGEMLLKWIKARSCRAIEELWVGFMAYSGYLDHLQDVVPWCKEHHPPDCWKSYNIAAMRPGALNILHPRNHRRQPPIPNENTERFCKLWGIPKDKRHL